MIRDRGLELIKAGYSVIPVSPHSKVPSIPAWQKNPLTEKACLERPANEGVGILCGYGKYPVVGLDCDIDGDEELASVVRSRFNEILGFEDANPIRHGKRPKFLILGRMDAAERFQKFTSTKYSKDEGETNAQVEVLGEGRFFVAYGIHPDTGKAYEWEDNIIVDKPEEIPVELLPVFSLAKLQECIRAFEAEVAKRGEYRAVATASGVGEALTGDWTDVEPQRAPMELRPKFIVAMLKDLTDEGKLDPNTYEAWLSVGMALHHQFSGGVEGLNIWNEWSAASPKYDANVLQEKWNSFGHYSAKMRTMRSFVHAWYALDKNDKYALCEAGLMHRTIREAGDRIRFVSDLNKFRECNKDTGRWLDVSETHISNRVFEVIEHGLLDEAKDVNEMGLQSRAESIVAFRAKSRASMCRVCTNVSKDLKATTLTQFKDFDSNPNIFAVGNGAVNLKTGAFIPPSPNLMLSKGSYVDYDPKARNTRWLQFIDEITNGDRATAGYLQRVVGYAMSGVPNEHVMFFLIGRGCNGKSVFLNTLAKVFGSYHKSVPADYFTQTERQSVGNGKGPDSVLVSMAGSRLAVSTETSLGASMQEAVIKRLVSRDVQTARPLYSGTMMEIVPTWVLFVATNHFPDVRTHDKGTWRRIRAIEFAVDFDDENHTLDPWLEDKLAQDLPGILNWCIEGYQMYCREGLKESEAITQFTEDLREQADVIARWMDANCVRDDSEVTPLKDAFASWQGWAHKEGSFTQYPNNKIFGQVLGEYGFMKLRTNQGYSFRGFRLKTDEEKAEAANEEELMGDFA